jgi:hypothetical protein
MIKEMAILGSAVVVFVAVVVIPAVALLVLEVNFISKLVGGN